MEELKDLIASNLIYLRKLNKMTQLELAEKLNYSDKSISKWEHGDTMPDIEVLQRIATLYNVTLDYLVSNKSHEEKIKFYKKPQNKQNQIIISLLWVSFVWITASIIFVYANVIKGESMWFVFVWAIPVSILMLLYFNKLWGSRKIKFVLLSVLLWSLLGCIYLQLVDYNIWLVFLIAVPIQTAIVLWSKIRV